MPLKGMAKDIVTIEKPDGSQIGGVQALVQSDMILIPGAEVPLEEGDLIVRRLRAGTEEMFEVLDRNFQDVGHGIEPHYQAKVRRVRQRRQLVPSADPDPRRVFVVHGRDEATRTALNSFLRSVDLRPIEWSEAVALTGSASPFIGEVVEAGFSAAQAVIVLLTGDDLARLREDLVEEDDPPHEREPTPQARPNVLFEAGYAFARHPKRTVLVELGQLRPFSDVQGRHVVRLNNSPQRRQELAQRLETAGCKINLKGTEWHEAGDFDRLQRGI